LVSRGEHLLYFAVSGLLALLPGLYLLAINEWDLGILLLIALGAFFVLFYTWPLKYLALGELAVLLVWGPLMIGGGHYVLTHRWDWNVVVASLPYVLGVTTVIFGKHIDKLRIDQQKRIFTLPVLVGEKTARYSVLAMMILPYLIVFYLIATRFFTPVLAIVLLAVPTLRRTVPALLKPKPEQRPVDFPDGQGGWPLYFAPLAFVNNRAFGTRFLLGVILDSALRLIPATASFWR
jgi:1,4-dihydroxy-2-naphthoate octaprenyltransferase